MSDHPHPHPHKHAVALAAAAAAVTATLEHVDAAAAPLFRSPLAAARKVQPLAAAGGIGRSSLGSGGLGAAAVAGGTPIVPAIVGLSSAAAAAAAASSSTAAAAGSVHPLAGIAVAPALSSSSAGTAAAPAALLPHSQLSRPLGVDALPPYTDTEFLSLSSDWKDSIAKSVRTPVKATLAADPSGRNADGFSPRTASLLDRSYMLPARLAKREARSYQSATTALASFQTKQFREVFAGAALGQNVARERELLQAEQKVMQSSASSAVLRPHMHSQHQRSPEKKASDLGARDSPLRALPLHASKSESRLQPASYFQRPDNSGQTHPGAAPTLVSKAARMHPPTNSVAPQRAQPASPAAAPAPARLSLSQTLINAAHAPISIDAGGGDKLHTGPDSDNDDEDATPSTVVVPPALSASLIFADMTGNRPQQRALNQAPQREAIEGEGDASNAASAVSAAVGDTSAAAAAAVTSAVPNSSAVVSTAAASASASSSNSKPPRRLAPVSSLQAEEDRLDPLLKHSRQQQKQQQQARRTAGSKDTPGAASAADGHASDDSISDIEVDYDDLLSTDDSDDGLDPNDLSTAAKIKRKPTEAEARAKARRKMHNPAQLSASMLILAGARLPEWPHAVDSEEEVDDDPAKYLGGAGEEASSSSEDESKGSAQHHRKHSAQRAPRINPYAAAAAREERDLHFLDGAGTAMGAEVSLQAVAEIAKKGRSLSMDTVHEEKESFEDGKRVLLSPAASASALDASLRTALGGGPLDRLAVVAAENLLKRLAKEALRRGGEYMRLDESQILERLEAERVAGEEAVRRAAHERRDALPSVVPRASSLNLGSSAGPMSSLSHARTLSELTPMQQKNLSAVEEERFREAERLMASRGDGAGGLDAVAEEEASAAAGSGADTDAYKNASSDPSKQGWKSFLSSAADAKFGDADIADTLRKKDLAARKRARKQLKSAGVSGPAGLAPKPKPTTLIITDNRGHVAPEFKRLTGPRAGSEQQLDAFGQPLTILAAQDLAALAPPVALAARGKFTTHSEHAHSNSGFNPGSASASGFPAPKPLPSVSVAAHLRPPRALGTQVERWLRKHGQIVRRKLDPQELAKYRQIFSLLDEDGSGTLSLDELQSALRDIQVHMTLEELAAMSADIKAESLRAQSQRRRNLINFDEFVQGLARAGEWDTLCRLADKRKANQAAKDAKQAALQARRNARHHRSVSQAGKSAFSVDFAVDIQDEHGNPFEPSAQTRRSQTSNATAGVAGAADVTATYAIDSRLMAAAAVANFNPDRMTLRTGRSSVMFGSAPVIGGAGLGIDSLTGEMVDVAPQRLTVRDLQNTNANSMPPSRRMSVTEGTAAGAAASAAVADTQRSDSSGGSASDSEGGGGGGISARSRPSSVHMRNRSMASVASAVTVGGSSVFGGGSLASSRGPAGSVSLSTSRTAATVTPSKTADLLPFTLWVPAYNRWKKLDKMMKIEQLSDAQLQALMEEEALGARGPASAVANAVLGGGTTREGGGIGGGVSPPASPPRSPSPHTRRSSATADLDFGPPRLTPKKPLPLLSHPSATSICPEEVFGTHVHTVIETEVVRQQPDGSNALVKVSRKVLVPVENAVVVSAHGGHHHQAAVEAASAAGASTADGERASGAVVVAKRKQTLGQLDTTKPETETGMATPATPATQEPSATAPASTAVDAAPAVTVAESAVSSLLVPGASDDTLSLSPRVPLASSSVLSPPALSRLTSPVRNAALSLSVSASQARLDKRGNVLDPAEMAGRDLLHPNQSKPYRTAQDESKLSALSVSLAARPANTASDQTQRERGQQQPLTPVTGSPVAVPRDDNTAPSATSASLTLDPLARESSQSLPFQWRQTQENVRVARLQAEASKAKAEFEALLAEEAASKRGTRASAKAGGAAMAGVGDSSAHPYQTPEQALAERQRKHNIAAEKHQALIRETESKRITREIFESFNQKQKARQEDQQKRLKAQEDQQLSINKEIKLHGVGSAGIAARPRTPDESGADSASAAAMDAPPSRDALLATRFQPSVALDFQSSGPAAAMFAAAASANPIRDAGVSTRMLAAAQHLRKEKLTNARLAVIAESKRKVKQARARVEALEEAAAARARHKKIMEREAAKEAAMLSGKPLPPSGNSSQRSQTSNASGAASSSAAATRARKDAAPAAALTPAEAAAAAVAALVEESAADPTLSHSDFIPLPSLDFLGGARLRAQMQLEAARREAMQRSMQSLDHFGELEAPRALNEDALLVPTVAADLSATGTDAVSTSLTLGVDPLSLVQSHKQVELDIGSSLSRLTREIERDEQEQQENEAKDQAQARREMMDAISQPLLGSAVSGTASSPATDLTSITSLWSSAARNIEDSRTVLREKQRAELQRARRAKKEEYAAQAQRAYGASIVDKNSAVSAAAARLSAQHAALADDDDDAGASLDASRKSNLEWLLFSGTLPSSPDAHPKRGSMVDEAFLARAKVAAQSASKT